MRHRTALNWLYPDQTNRWKATHSAQVGVGVQGGSGLWSPPLRSVSEYLILVYSRPLILLFWNEEAKTSQDKSATITQRHRRSWCWFHMAAWKWNVTLTGSSKTDEYTHLLLLYAALQCLYVMLNCHVDEAVLGLSLHHSWALWPHHLDRLGHINITVHS